MILDPNFILRVGLALLSAAVLSFAVTPLVKRLAQKVGAMDVPTDSRRMHHHPIPRMGGLAIFLAFLASVLIFAYPEIDREIRAMPDGYDTYVGERGVMLSGGQKQRLSIARLFLKNPQILILDEATSALDSVTEQRIQNALDTLARGRTCIIIAHRLSTVQGADRVAVIDGAHVCEQGPPAELIARDGKYAALCRAQHLI